MIIAFNMGVDSDVHRRRSIRLQGYDYSEPGAYFTTVCTQGKQCLFGDVLDEEMKSNDAGRMIHEVWEGLPLRFHTVEVDQFVVMPNHFHGIVVITDGTPVTENVGATLVVAHDRAGTRPAPTVRLGDVIGAFKSITTQRYISGVINRQWPPLAGRLWQRNYYERVIRNEKELSRVREYIMINPLKWALDPENPAARNTGTDAPWLG